MTRIFSNEDPRAFPYLPPSHDLVSMFPCEFLTSSPFPERGLLRCIDLLVSIAALVIALPLLLAVAAAIWTGGRLSPDDAGPLLDPYIAASRGKKFLKLKFRTLKWCHLRAKRQRLDFRCRPSEHDESNLTTVGRLLKKYYLDELPQLLNIIRGDMSLVGPRPLAWHHYVAMVRQGHPVRKLLKAGLLGPTHVRKGSPAFPDLIYDYKYADMYLRCSSLRLLWEGAKIAARGIGTVLAARGL